MSEPIGDPITELTLFNINTLMPSITDSADIQEALRLYHFGAPSTGVGSYSTTNTAAVNLVNPSIAHSLYSLQTQITAVAAGSGVPAINWTNKGALVSASGVSTVSTLSLPSQSTANDGQVLTIAYSGSATGLTWASPPVTLTNTVTLTNKTLTAPKITASSFLADTNGNAVFAFPALVTTPVNYLTISNTATTVAPTLTATGTDTNISINLIPKGTGRLQVSGVEVDTISSTTTLTNKTLTTPTINAPTVTQLYLSDSVVVFEGSTADSFETTLTVTDPTADRTIILPNVDGTVITTGNLSSITALSNLTTVGTITSGTFPAANISGTTLASNVTTSSLTTVGTLGSLAVTGNAVSHIAFNTSPTGNYTLVTADDGKIIEMSSGGVLTVPADGGTFVVPVGTQITILQTGASQVQIAGLTASVVGTPGLKLRAQWSSCTLLKRAANSWVAMGDLTA